MNRFEKALYETMTPTAELLERTTEPLHRAILLNFWRHVHLEGSGRFDEIVAPDMMVDHPVYRVTWGAHPAVIEGKDGVVAFYNSVGNSVLWNSDDRLAVADWGVADAGSDTTRIRLRMWCWWIRQITQNDVPGSALTAAVNVNGSSNGAPELTTLSPV